MCQIKALVCHHEYQESTEGSGPYTGDVAAANQTLRRRPRHGTRPLLPHAAGKERKMEEMEPLERKGARRMHHGEVSRDMAMRISLGTS